MIIIKPATENDIDRIMEIEHDSFTPPWTHGQLLAEIYREDSFFIVALDDDEIVGYAILGTSIDEGQILSIAVVSTARRKGIADLLMYTMITHAKELELESIFLEVRKSNEPAQELYKKHDFEFVRYRENYYTDPDEDAVVLKRDLEVPKV